MEEANHKKQLLSYGLVCLDQTQLVSALFKIDDWTGEDERIEIKQLDELREINTWAYPVQAPIGEIIVPEEQYYAIIDDYNDQLKVRKAIKESHGTYIPSQIEVDKANQEIVVLNAEMELYENAEPFQRPVFSWWAIPYWLSEKLVEKGEAILRGYGCSWWGITDKSIVHPAMSDILKAINMELLSTNNKPGENECATI